MKYTFDKIQIRAQKKGVCDVCGTRRMRAKTFWKTVNPFNKNRFGRMKTREEVLRDVQAEARAWKELPVRCADCQLAVKS